MPERPEEESKKIEQKIIHLERSLQYITEEYVQRMRELSLIRRIAEALTDASNQKKVCLELSNIILDEINAENCVFILLDDSHKKFIIRVQQNQQDRKGTYYKDDTRVICNVDEGIAGSILRNKAPLYIRDIDDQPEYRKDRCIEPDATSILLLPLLTKDEAIGLIVLSAPENDAFSTEDQRILEIIANQSAIVLNNVQILARLKNANDQQAVLLKKLSDAEKELSNYAQDLEKMVDKRTNELIQSEKMAVIGQLVAGVAHELNNPLAIITGYIDILSSNPDMPPKFVQKLKKVQQATFRSAKIVNNLLRFSRKGTIEKENVDINLILNVAVELYEYQFRSLNINVIKKLDPDLPTTVGDSQQLQQVFLNLLSNASDALAEQSNHRFITISTTRDDDVIVCDFKDTGPGIDEKCIEKLFKPFFTTKEPGKGTGLGLSLATEVLEEHGGSIEYDSSYTGGARFILRIPVKTEELDDDDSQEQPANILDETIRVLLIDEERDIIAFQRDILMQRSCQVDGTHYAQEALAKIGGEEYDLIVMDVNVHGNFDGLNLYEKILDIKPEMEDFIIFTTGNIGEVKTRKIIESTDHIVIEKPFLVKDYVQALNMCLSRLR